jgi:hypothetical protein
MGQPGLGKRFIAHVRNKVNFIRQNPKTVALRYDDIRTVMLDTFPYMIHFKIDDGKEMVVIMAVLNTSRDTQMWRDR